MQCDPLKEFYSQKVDPKSGLQKFPDMFALQKGVPSGHSSIQPRMDITHRKGFQKHICPKSWQDFDLFTVQAMRTKDKEDYLVVDLFSNLVEVKEGPCVVRIRQG